MIPGGTFQGWLERDGWIKRFTQAAQPGAYLRVIEPGDIRAADPFEIVYRPDYDVTVELVFRAMTLEPDLLPRLLVAEALPLEEKELARKRSAQTSAAGIACAGEARESNVGVSPSHHHDGSTGQHRLADGRPR
jgi:MOSC domain-containing protein YiiM